MVKYNVEREFNKISGSFSKVRLDMNKLYSIVTELQIKVEEQEDTIKVLSSELDDLKLNNVMKDSKKIDERLIVGNIESKKFHYSSCPYAKNIKGDNKIVFDGIEQAIKSGYNECTCVRE